MSEDLIKAIILASIFVIQGCLVSILLFVYYSKEQKMRSFQAQIEAEAKALKARQGMEDFVEAMASQYNERIKDFIKWACQSFGLDEATAMDKFGDWKPYIPDSYYWHVANDFPTTAGNVGLWSDYKVTPQEYHPLYPERGKQE